MSLNISSFSPPTTWNVTCSWVHVPIGAPSMQNQPSILSFNVQCYPCRISAGYGYVLPSQITNYQATPFLKLHIPPFQLRDGSNIDRMLRRPRQGSSALMHVIRRSESSWSMLGASLSADNGRGDEGTGETTEIRRAGMDSLEIDEDVQESVARAINQRPMINPARR